MADIIGVSALNKYVRSLLESDEFLADIAIRGEISNLNHHFKTGHYYFTLKDDKASVKAVMFRTSAQNLSFRPENGMGVVARCRVSLFERDGAFQLYVEHLFPDGVGAALMAFEQLKGRLEGEGLFAPEHKKPLPPWPDCVGLVTSKTGAALQDILKVARRRCPAVRFLLVPVTVQGQAAAPDIAAAVQRLDESGRVDVIIVARGGGSAEDLAVFNAEEIARAVFACRTPVVSAVGHEIDFTILDFVADLRAPTPSAAAEMVLPDLAQAHAALMNICRNIANNMHARLDSCYNDMKRAARHPALQQVRIAPAAGQERLAALAVMLQRAARQRLGQESRRFAAAAALAGSLNPYAVLARGYGIVREKSGGVLSSVQAVATGQQVDVTLQDGVLGCRVEEIQSMREIKA